MNWEVYDFWEDIFLRLKEFWFVFIEGEYWWWYGCGRRCFGIWGLFDIEWLREIVRDCGFGEVICIVEERIEDNLNDDLNEDNGEEVIEDGLDERRGVDFEVGGLSVLVLVLRL